MLKGMALSPLAGVDGAARLAVDVRRNERGPSAARVVSRLPVPARSRSRVHGALRLQRGARSAWAAAAARARSGASSSPATTFRSSAFAPQRGRTLLPSDEIAPGRHPVVVLSDGLWRRDFGADPDIVGKTVEINNYPLTVVGVADPTFHGTTVVYDVELFIPVMMAPQLGFTFGSQQTTPSAILSDRRAARVRIRRATCGRARRSRAPRRRPTRCGPTLARDRPLDRRPAAAEGRAVLADAGRRADRSCCRRSTSERDGPAGAADRVREHRRARAGARAVAARRDRGAAGARRDAHADRPSAGRREPRARRAGRAARRSARAARESRCSSGTPRRWPRRERLFFNIGVDGLVIGFAALVACGERARVRIRSGAAELAGRSGVGHQRRRVAARRGARTAARRPGRRAGRGVAAAPGRRRAGDAQRRRRAARQSGIRREPRDGDRGGRQAERATTSRAAACSIASCWTRRAPMPASNRRRSRRTRRWRSSTRRRGASRSRATSRVGAKIWRSCRTPSVRTTSARCGFRSSPAGSSKTATTKRGAGGDGQQHARAAILGRRGKRDRQARARRRGGDWRTVVGVAADVKYARINEAAAPVRLPAVPAGVPVEHDPAHTRPSAAIDRLVDQARARTWRRSTPTCRSCTSPIARRNSCAAR